MNFGVLVKSFFLVTAICCISFFAYAQNSVPVFDFTKYENRILHKNDTLYIVNFWATWCKPCIEELPIFEKVAQTYTQQPVKIILVSQDAKTRAVQVNDFLQKNKYTSESFILSAGNPNVWIDKIDSNWSGTIPMTLFYKNGNKIYFHEGDYETYDELDKIIHSKL
ncbi:MAG TPA: thioredoxin domain-containing protein [Chitinophagales bacterium]|nr:thioredoxin domain-containing protein [Chitinophagales bacterium]